MPREGIVANINVDGAIGIFGDTKGIVARGAEHSTLDVNVRAAAGRIGYAISPDPTPEEVLFIRSDQYSFVRRGIPALYVTEGSQAADPEVDQLARAREWLATRYHTPLDSMAQPTDYEAIVKGARFLLLLGYDVAQRDARPEWNSGDFFGELYGKQR